MNFLFLNKEYNNNCWSEAEAPILLPPDVKNQLTGKHPDVGTDRKQKEKRWQEMNRLDGIADSADVNLSKLQETVKKRAACHAAVHRITKSWTQLGDWMITITTRTLGKEKQNRRETVEKMNQNE